MKLWISKQTDAPIREQIVTQMTLAISSGDISVGEKLPSRGELARRFGIHENTVSNAYKVLAEKGLVEFRQGSGFYAVESSRFTSHEDLEWLTAIYLRDAFKAGADSDGIETAIREHLARMQTDGIVVIEENKSLREIIIHEIGRATGLGITGIAPDDLTKGIPDGKCVALADEKRKIKDKVADCLYLKSRSIPEAMADRERPAPEALIALVSGWDGFLKMAQTILIAVQIDPDSILVRSTADDGWEKGISSADLIIADSLAAESFRNDARLRVFPLISDHSLEELNALALK
ncbi:MAG: winged helix-turn-helix transcriptional regulator [Pyrinomonadaceae bacterium]|nr:winged helix-turn-helix transcriptional regulator [Pyrinomonadaceae bacterium]